MGDVKAVGPGRMIPVLDRPSGLDGLVAKAAKRRVDRRVVHARLGDEQRRGLVPGTNVRKRIEPRPLGLVVAWPDYPAPGGGAFELSASRTIFHPSSVR